MLSEINRKLFVLSKLKGIGPATLQKLLSAPGFSTSAIDDLARSNAKVQKALVTPGAWEEANKSADKDIAQASSVGVRIISLLDDAFPTMLKTIPDKPFFLFVLGNWAADQSRAVAVIGTRQPTEHGKLTAERITDYLVQNQWSIVSGLAIGCDTIAHQRALAGDGHTVAVLAHGLHTIAPKQNTRLAEEIVGKGGALVSEYSFGVEPFAPQYVKRDRIQAGLSRGVVMIQSDRNGGSMHASRAAISYRRLLAVPSATARDEANRESKVEANTILAGNNQTAKTELLDCDESALDHLLVVRGKEDYPVLSKSLAAD
jgi:DNA processing protein